MSELVRYSDFSPEHLAARLGQLVNRESVAKGLSERNILGPVARYADPEMAFDSIRRGQQFEDPVEHFAVVDDAGDIQGGASIYHGLRLNELQAPVPPALARVTGLSNSFRGAGPNIHAWVADNDPELTQQAYEKLLQRVGVNYPFDPLQQRVMRVNPNKELPGKSRTAKVELPWTIEPERSPSEIHAAIGAAGLVDVGDGRFDDGEHNWFGVPPVAVLYTVSPYGDARISRVLRNEIEFGKRPGIF